MTYRPLLRQHETIMMYFIHLVKSVHTGEVLFYHAFEHARH